jgi:hypothetical protein
MNLKKCDRCGVEHIKPSSGIIHKEFKVLPDKHIKGDFCLWCLEKLISLMATFLGEQNVVARELSPEDIRRNEVIGRKGQVIDFDYLGVRAINVVKLANRVFDTSKHWEATIREDFTKAQLLKYRNAGRLTAREIIEAIEQSNSQA